MATLARLHFDDKTLLESFKRMIVDASHAKDFIYLLLKHDIYSICMSSNVRIVLSTKVSLKKPKYYSSGNVSYVNTFSQSEAEGKMN